MSLAMAQDTLGITIGAIALPKPCTMFEVRRGLNVASESPVIRTTAKSVEKIQGTTQKSMEYEERVQRFAKFMFELPD